MPAVRYARAARDDLRDIWCWIADDSRPAADRLIADIERRCGILRHFPMLGTLRADVGEGIRSLVVGRFIVLYGVTARGVLVKRIVHTRRDIRRLQD